MKKLLNFVAPLFIAPMILSGCSAIERPEGEIVKKKFIPAEKCSIGNRSERLIFTIERYDNGKKETCLLYGGGALKANEQYEVGECIGFNLYDGCSIGNCE